MVHTRYMTAIIICLLTICDIRAQDVKPSTDKHMIEMFLDNTPGIYGSLDFNDFFSDSYVTAKVYADEDSAVTRIKIGESGTVLSGNCDSNSLKCAEKLLKESCRSIIKERKWKPGKSECVIVWKPRHNHKIEKKPADGELMSFIEGLVTDETRKELHNYNCSAFIRLKTDSAGRILDAGHIGNIFWSSRERSENITGLSAGMISGYKSSGSIMFIPERYMNGWEYGLCNADKLLKKSSKEITRRLAGKQFDGLTGVKREICIEICIDAPDIGIEESDPIYPGGVEALKEFYTENLRHNRMLRKSRITGLVNVNLLIKKNGKAKLLDIEAHELMFTWKDNKPWYKIEKKIKKEIKRITGKMPRWTPGRCDNENVETKCSFGLRLDGDK